MANRDPKTRFWIDPTLSDSEVKRGIELIDGVEADGPFFVTKDETGEVVLRRTSRDESE